MAARKTRTLTVRLSGPALRLVRERARARGVTPSELIRAMLQEADDGDVPAGDPTALELTRRWVGSVRSDVRSEDELATWSPDRRD